MIESTGFLAADAISRIAVHRVRNTVVRLKPDTTEEALLQPDTADTMADNRLRLRAQDRMIMAMPEPNSRRTATITRRAALKAFGTGVGAATLLPWLSDDGLLAFSGIQATNAAPAPKLLSKTQYATLETLVEAIIPTDERSPGAKQARVADYIDLLLSESDADVALQWLGGLAALDSEASARFNAPFGRLNEGQIDQILRDISRNELEPHTPLERFFAMTKQATIQGYYTSEIGIHQELRYKGNKFLREFVGCETEDGKDCQYCGQKDTKGTKDTKAPGRQG